MNPKHLSSKLQHMGKRWFVLLLLLLGAAPVWAGDEDVKEETPKVVRPKVEEVEAPPAPEEPEPDLAIGSQEPAAPAPAPEQPPAQKSRPAPARRPITSRAPDDNINYDEILGRIAPEALPVAVRQPSIGTRGYRPNMIAVGVGDRTPGVGLMVEYNWNRIGFGVAYSYRSLGSEDAYARSQSFVNAYTYYHWLPFFMTPYFLLGMEKAIPSDHGIGALAGVGIETQIYRGWTTLLGYTYHSAVHEGFLGGSLGWAF